MALPDFLERFFKHEAFGGILLMAAAVAAREAHDARCAAAEAGADLQDAKFEATRLKGDVARAELGRTPFRASARKSPRASPRGTAGFPLHDDEAAELTVTLDTYVPPEKPKPSVSDRLAALRAERAAEKPRGLRAANSPPALSLIHISEPTRPY